MAEQSCSHSHLEEQAVALFCFAVKCFLVLYTLSTFIVLNTSDPYICRAYHLALGQRA